VGPRARAGGRGEPGVGGRDLPGEEGLDQLHRLGVSEAESDEKTSRVITWFTSARRT
jgi:hypothetical protein